MNRQQFVSLNGEVSLPQMTKTGVSQVSALGPSLFLIFMNDLPQHITNAHSNIFADDSVIYAMGKSTNETRRVMQEFNNNNLPVNLLKTICMLTLSSSNLNKIADADNITRELTGICITSRVQKVWVVEFVNGPTEIPQWPFLSVPVRAFERGVCPKLHPKTV